MSTSHHTHPQSCGLSLQLPTILLSLCALLLACCMPHEQMSEDLLAEQGEVERSMEARVALASALARQWFGVLLVRAPDRARPYFRVKGFSLLFGSSRV
jgi:hypothetical protein